MAFTDRCEINGPNKKNDNKKIKRLLAMAIDSATNKSGASRGSISRNCENAWSHSVYSAFERFFRPALRGDGLPFQRHGGECAGFAQLLCA
jgi:hypothetical protein